MIGEVSSVLGLRVYTENGKYVGTVADLLIDIDARQVKGLLVVDVNRMLINTKEIIIPYRFVKAIGDIVIIKIEKEKLLQTLEEKYVSESKTQLW